MRKCPKCNELISGQSKICRKCGAILEEVAGPPQGLVPPGRAQTSQSPWQDREREESAGQAAVGLPSAGDDEQSPARPPREIVSSPSRPWACPKCRETVPAEFEVCWNCGTAFDGTEDPGFVAVDEEDGQQDGEPDYLYGADNGPEPGTGEDQAMPALEAIEPELPVGHQRTVPCCARCGSTNIIPSAFVAGQGEFSGGQLSVVVCGDPDGPSFRDRVCGELRAWICGRCGHTELYVADPEGLYEQYLRSLGK